MTSKKAPLTTDGETDKKTKVVQIRDASDIQITDVYDVRPVDRPKTYVKDGIEYTEDGEPLRVVYIERPDRDEIGLTKLFDGEFNINDYLEQAIDLTKVGEVAPEITADIDAYNAFDAYISRTRITNGEFPAEAQRFNEIVKAAIEQTGAPLDVVQEEIDKLSDVFQYFYRLHQKSDEDAITYVASRLSLVVETVAYEALLRSKFSKAILADPELTDLMQRAAPYYRTYKHVELLSLALEDPDLRVNIFKAFRNSDDFILEIEENARDLTEVANDLSLLTNPAKCPREFIFLALMWGHTHPGNMDTDEYLRQMVADVIGTQKAAYSEIIATADKLGPEALDENAAKLGLIDLMSVARDFSTVKSHYSKLKPLNNTAKKIFTKMAAAKQSDIIASNSYIYREIGAISLDEWLGIDPLLGKEYEEYKPNQPMIVHRPKGGLTEGANERIFIKYTPRPWDRFVLAVYDAIATCYFNSPQWQNRTNEFVNVSISYYTLREMVAPQYFRYTSEKHIDKRTKQAKVYENSADGAKDDDKGVMSAIIEAVNVLMASVLKIEHNRKFKDTYVNLKEGDLSEVETELNAIYAFYSKWASKSGEWTEGLTVMAPPTLPYECRMLGQTVPVPRKDLLSNGGFAKYLKDELGIDSQPFTKFKDYSTTNPKFVTFSNTDISIRVKGSVATAFNVLRADVEKNGLKHAISSHLNVYDWNNDLFPAVFGTLSGEWVQDEDGKTVSKTPKELDYDSLPKKDKLQAKKIAIATANNLMVRYGVKFEVIGANGRNTTGTGIKFYPVGLAEPSKKSARQVKFNVE